MFRASFNHVSVSFFLFWAAVAWLGVSPTAYAREAKSPKDMPVEAFAQLPSVSNPKLSPDGSKVAFLTSEKGRVSLTHVSLDGKGGSKLPAPQEMDILDFHWANDDVLLLEAGLTWNRAEFVGYVYHTRIISYNIPKRRYTWLGEPQTRLFGSLEMGDAGPSSQHERVVSFLPDDPDGVLIQLDFELDSNPTVYWVNVNTGKRHFILNDRKGITNWYSDQEDGIRFGTGFDNVGEPLKIFKGASDDWQDLSKLSWSSRFVFKGFAKDKNQLFVNGLTKQATLALYRIDAASGDIIEEVASHESVDINGPVFDPTSRHLVGIAFTDDFRRITYSDPAFTKVQERIDYKKRGHVNTIIDKARDNDIYLFEMHSDTIPSIYYVYNADTDKVTRIGKSYEDIDLRLTARTKAISIPVRDGSAIPGYITIPSGKEPSNLPTIIMPHGGPEARDDAEWDYWAQFYASRGYLVVKPNFRGSTGYGQDFRRRGRQQWGGLMQDDITDATKWVVSEGMADPARICIVGASFGGYAALMGTVKEPGLYRCAISINGVTNLPAMKAKDERYVGGDYWIQFMGLEGTSDSEVSPYDRAEEIIAPVLLMSTKDDARVPYKLSKDMHKRLQKLGKDSLYIELQDGGHGLMSNEARLVMLMETEKFLKVHIGND